MNNLLLLGLGVLVLFLVMNGSKGKGKSKSGSLSKSVSKELEGNGALILLAVGAVVLFMCMNKGLVEGTDGGDTNCKIDIPMNVLDYLNHVATAAVVDPNQEYYTPKQQARAIKIVEYIKGQNKMLKGSGDNRLCKYITPSCKTKLSNGGLDSFLSCITTQIGGNVEDNAQKIEKELGKNSNIQDDGN